MRINMNTKLLVRNGAYSISLGPRKSNRGNIGIPTVCRSYCFCYCCMLCVHGMMSGDEGLVVALDVRMLSWFDLLLCTNHTHTP